MMFPQTFIVQLLCLLAVNSTLLITVITWQPFKEWRRNASVVAEETVFFVLNYLVLISSGWVEDDQVVDSAGYLLVAIPLTFVLLWYFAFGLSAVCKQRSKCKRRLYIRRAMEHPRKSGTRPLYRTWVRGLKRRRQEMEASHEMEQSDSDDQGPDEGNHAEVASDDSSFCDSAHLSSYREPSPD